MVEPVSSQNEARTTITMYGTLVFPSVAGYIFTAMVNVRRTSDVLFPTVVRKKLSCSALPRQKYFKQSKVIKLVHKVRSYRKGVECM